MNRTLRVTCPTCRREIEWSVASPWRPFCSARCKGIDLGEWAAERFVIAGDPGDIESTGDPPAMPGCREPG